MTINLKRHLLKGLLDLVVLSEKEIIVNDYNPEIICRKSNKIIQWIFWEETYIIAKKQLLKYNSIKLI